MVKPDKTVAGFTIGNDMSARDIEGENPLYLPQAKFYEQCCALGPCVLIPEQEIDLPATKVTLTIERAGSLDADAVVAALEKTDIMGVYSRPYASFYEIYSLHVSRFQWIKLCFAGRFGGFPKLWLGRACLGPLFMT